MKVRTICLSVALCIALSGCASVSNFLEDKMVEKADISSDREYLTYQLYNAEGKLTSQGYYSEDEFNMDVNVEHQPADTVLVSFAKNNCLEVNYYTDAKHTIKVANQACCLNPGQSIYAVVEISDNVQSSRYAFECFRLYKFIDGNRKFVDTITLAESGFVMEITEDMVGYDFTLEPIGDYQSSIISLRDYYKDNEGNEYNLNGEWYIDEEIIDGNEVEINAISSYVISYKYDTDSYFYISSTPECQYSNHEDGIVIFELMKAKDKSQDYYVELAEYLTVNIANAVNRKIIQSTGNSEDLSAGHSYTINKLKYGDEITLITDKEWPQLENSRELIMTVKREHSTGEYAGFYEYVLIVPQKDGNFIFDPNEYEYEHGAIIFKCFGDIVTNIQHLAKGARIYYYAGEIDEGYWLPEGIGSIIVGEEEETRLAIKNIHFEPKIKVLVNIPQPSYGGKILYSVNEQILYGTTCSLTSGDEISMVFEPWPGWCLNSNCISGDTYRVTDDENQSIKFSNNVMLDDLFYEADNHKPTLEVVLHKSVGANMNLSVLAEGISLKNNKHSGRWIDNYKVVLEPTIIGTARNIELIFNNHALEPGTAVKILVEKEDSKGYKTNYHYLINNLAAQVPPIQVYKDGERSTSKIYFKSIKVTISVVEAQEFTAPKKPEHGTITVREASTNTLLKNGDLIEPNESVVVTLISDYNYYLTGKNVSDDIFKDTMKYTDYLKNISDIIRDHPIEKYINLTLSNSDAYGVCTYSVDKKTLTDSVRLKLGQKLTVTYTITADGYTINGGARGVLGIGKTETKKTASIEIISDMDGVTITRANFGIDVVKED